jgi:molybdopterin-guanine dinucleotide biosynthesis protein A
MVGDIIKVRGPMTGIFSALSLPDVSAVFVTAPDSPSKKSKTSLVPHKRDVRIILEEKN